MRFQWSPDRGSLNGAVVFLSASVPDPQRDARFLAGPMEHAPMLRVIDRRVDDAVQSLLAQTLNAGGRIVHGGHPKILPSIAHQANHWKVAENTLPPIRIYQSEFFRKSPPPAGREEMVKAGTGTVVWVSSDLEAVSRRRNIPKDLIERFIPLQAPPAASGELRASLLAMRLEMLLDSQPQIAICIGGMEGIEAEAKLYLELVKLGFIPAADHIHVIGSTYGAAARLEGEKIRLADQIFANLARAKDPLAPNQTLNTDLFNRSTRSVGGFESPPLPSEMEEPMASIRRAAYHSTLETAHQDLSNRLSYDGVMRALLAHAVPNTSAR